MRGGAREEKVLTDREVSTRRDTKARIMQPEALNTNSVTPAIKDITREPVDFDDFTGAVADRLDLQEYALSSIGSYHLLVASTLLNRRRRDIMDINASEKCNPECETTFDITSYVICAIISFSTSNCPLAQAICRAV